MKSNVLLIIIDSFREDRFIGKSKTSQTPNLDYLIENGTYFSQTISSADATLLSWSSIFTGLHPFKTGIRSASFNKLNPNIITYFKIFETYGYNLYGYVPSVGETIGLFPEFKNNDAYYQPYKNLYEGNGKILTDQIFDKLKNMQEPWLLLLHLYDLHDPVSVPKHFNNDKYGTTNYEKQISAIDNWIGKLLTHVDLKTTLLIMTADHGKYIKKLDTFENNLDLESNPKLDRALSVIGRNTPKFLHPLKEKIFFSMESMSKKKKMRIIEKLNLSEHEKQVLLSGKADVDHYLYDDKVRVPLLFVGLNVVKNKKISLQTRLIDLFPTISDLIGIPARDESIDGRSLKPLIDSKNIQEQPAYMESNPLVSAESNDVIGIRTSRYKYFRDITSSKKRVFLFDLKADPAEINNLANINPKIVEEMETILSKIKNNRDSLHDNSDDSNSEDSKLIEEELKKLGYM